MTARHKETKHQHRARQRGRQRRYGRPSFLALLRTPPARGRLLKGLKQLWRVFDQRRLAVHCGIGLGDPADTGQLWAVLGPLAAWSATFNEVEIMLAPDFTAQAVEVKGTGRFRWQPLRVLIVVTALALSPTLWRTFLQPPQHRAVAA